MNEEKRNKYNIYIDATNGNTTENLILHHCHITCLFLTNISTLLKTQVAV